MIINSDKRLSYLLAFLFPIIGLLLAFKWRYTPWAKNLFWIFCSFTGLVIIYTYSESMDIYRYAMQLKDYYYADTSFNELSTLFFTQEGVDIYQFIMVYFTSRFTDNAHLLFLFYAIIYGFFYSRNIWYIYEKKNNQNKSYHIGILIIFIALIWPIWQIAGARFGTAFHLFVYGAMPFIYEKDKSKMIFLFLSPLVHFSFLFPVAVFLLYIILPKNQTFVLVFYIISLFIKEINLPVVNDFLNSYLPSFLHKRVDSYINETYLMEVIEKSSNYAFHFLFMNYVGYILIQILLFLTFYVNMKYLKNNSKVQNFYFFSVLLYACSNIFALIPDGLRFLSLSQMFLLISIVFCFSELKISHPFRKRVIPLTLFFIIPMIIKLRVGCDYYGFSLLGNFISAFIIEDVTPIIEYIKN